LPLTAVSSLLPASLLILTGFPLCEQPLRGLPAYPFARERQIHSFSGFPQQDDQEGILCILFIHADFFAFLGPGPAVPG
jgi:hypothetical protein